jgi:nucleoid-associated protein YgaU
VIAPQFRDYTVRPGDTFQAIARRELGSGEHASAIARANPLLDPTRIRAGQVIRIPVDPRNIQGREIATQTTHARPAAIEYTVKSGDTLSGISRDFYGTTAHADHILSANRTVIPSARQLRAGQIIVIPPPPTSADGASGPGTPRQEE